MVDSFNSDKPYHVFIKEQLAGDVIEPVETPGIVATGFLVAGPWDEAGMIQQSVVMKARGARGGAGGHRRGRRPVVPRPHGELHRCHDHKFDPIPTRDYYRIKAALEGVVHGSRPALQPGQLKADEAKRASLAERIRDLEKEVASIECTARKTIRDREGSTRTRADFPSPSRLDLRDRRARRGRLTGRRADRRGDCPGRPAQTRWSVGDLMTKAFSQEIREKTLETWVALADLKQRGGAAISMERDDGKAFDAIVFAERQPATWLAGSELFRRTRDLTAPAESAKPGELVHLAIVYASDGSISLYRNGTRYGERYSNTGESTELQTYPAGQSHVLIGLRHLGHNERSLPARWKRPGCYDRALTDEQVARSFGLGVDRITTDAAGRGPRSRCGRARREVRLAELDRARSDLAGLPPSP